MVALFLPDITSLPMPVYAKCSDREGIMHLPGNRGAGLRVRPRVVGGEVGRFSVGVEGARGGERWVIGVNICFLQDERLGREG